MEKLLEDGVELIFVWGGDGTVQRVIDTAVGSYVTLAIVPAGTANLFATNLDIPNDLEEAVRSRVARVSTPARPGPGQRRALRVMAGAGLDALMIREADAGLKDNVGRVAYVWTGVKNVRKTSVKMRIEVIGQRVVRGEGELPADRQRRHVIGGITAFEDAGPDDGCSRWAWSPPGAR